MSEKNNINRRGFVKGSILTPATAAAALTLEERILDAAQKKGAAAPKNKGPAGDMPMGTIAGVAFSRMICGGNILAGYAHARDLVYVSSLMKKYNTEERVMDTLQLCEEHGINSFLINPTQRTRKIAKRYWKERGGKIKWIVDSRPELKDIKPRLEMAMEAGAAAIYVNGGWAERWVREGKTEMLGKVVEFIRKAGMPAGIGGHLLDVPVACHKAGITPDFYMKTLHSRKYWSAQAEREHDNIWCRKPAETIAFMKKIDVPWIAYKTLAAGAINPTVGFKYALRNGADFLCVGMFDFQVADDVQIFKGLMKRTIKRDRPWYG